MRATFTCAITRCFAFCYFVCLIDKHILLSRICSSLLQSSLVTGYAFFTIILKLVFQAHIICMCNNEFSIAPMCPYTNGTYNNFNDHCVPAYEELPYYNGEPIILDYWWGLEKAADQSQSPSTYVDMPFYPFKRVTSTDSVGTLTEVTLDAGVSGAFFLSVIGDVFVILMVMLHTHLLKMRGVWGLRDDEVKKEHNEEESEVRDKVDAEEVAVKVNIFEENTFRPISIDTSLSPTEESRTTFEMDSTVIVDQDKKVDTRKCSCCRRNCCKSTLLSALAAKLGSLGLRISVSASKSRRTRHITMSHGGDSRFCNSLFVTSSISLYARRRHRFLLF